MYSDQRAIFLAIINAWRMIGILQDLLLYISGDVFVWGLGDWLEAHKGV